MIEVRNLSFGYARPDEIYRDFSWSTDTGESWVVLGPSGCGKTTLVYLLAGLRRASSGSVWMDGSEVTVPRTGTGLILQDHGLLPWAKARDNVALGLKIRGVPPEESDAKVRYWLERLGIDSIAQKYPGQLSGGQRQRVAIARTLALSPSLLLMDEPFSSLDSSTREDLQELVVQLSDGSGVTTVLVTHDIQEAVFMGKRILVAGRSPIDSYVVIENPEARQSGYRQSPEFFARCAEVRRITAELGTERPAGAGGSAGPPNPDPVGAGGPAGPPTTGGEGMPPKGQSPPHSGGRTRRSAPTSLIITRTEHHETP